MVSLFSMIIVFRYVTVLSYSWERQGSSCYFYFEMAQQGKMVCTCGRRMQSWRHMWQEAVGGKILVRGDKEMHFTASQISHSLSISRRRSWREKSAGNARHCVHSGAYPGKKPQQSPWSPSLQQERQETTAQNEGTCYHFVCKQKSF